MKPVAIIICNYNKRDYVIKNIESLKKQTITDFDIYVVDNASTDGSVEEVHKLYGESVACIVNEQNLGGSGGFNTGLRFACNKGYQYIVLLDNDVVLGEDCIRELYDSMKSNPTIGMMGAKILKMDYPDIIQEFGPIVNYDTITFELTHGGEKDNPDLPHLAECDYVPACAMMVRKDVVDIIGCMPEENFIYYDDIEWGIKCNRAGYKVVANSQACAWHKGGAGVNPSTFGTYYLNRNKIKLFTTYLKTEKTDIVSPDDVDRRIDLILRDIFEGIYSCEYKGMHNVVKTRVDAFVDSLNEVNGKAEAYMIRDREKIEEKFDEFIKNANSVRIYMNGLYEETRRIMNCIQTIEKNFDKEITIELTDASLYVGETCLGVNIRDEEATNDADFDLVFHVCKHIYKTHITSFENKWVDGWRNTIFDQEDFENYLLYDRSYELFKRCFEEKVRNLMNNKKGDFANV